MTLSPRRYETLARAAHGRTADEIASEMGVTTFTVHRALTETYNHLGVIGGPSGLTMIRAFRAMGWLVAPDLTVPGSPSPEVADESPVATNPSPRRSGTVTTRRAA